MAVAESLLLLPNIIKWHFSSLCFMQLSENQFASIELSVSSLSRSELHAIYIGVIGISTNAGILHKRR